MSCNNCSRLVTLGHLSKDHREPLRKIVFNVPSLLPEAGPPVAREGPGSADLPGSREPAPGPEGAGDTRKLAMLVDASQALTGTLGLHGGPLWRGDDGPRGAWRSSPAHGATVRGVCSAGFKRAVEAMHRSVTHGAEVALPAAGEETRRERLENYAWTAEVAPR